MNPLALSSVVIGRASQCPGTRGVSSYMDLNGYRGRLEAQALRLSGNREDAADLVQETLIRAHRFPPDPTQNIHGWLLKVLQRCYIDLRRTRSRRPQYVAVDAGLEDGSTHYDIRSSEAEDEPPVSDETRALFSALLTTLPNDQREVIAMLSSDISYREIAVRLGVPVGTVRSRIHRARRGLERRLASIR